MAAGRWMHDLYTVDNSIVGTTTEDQFGRGWWAHGCLDEWQDTELGMFDTREKARHSVEQWVKDHD